MTIRANHHSDNALTPATPNDREHAISNVDEGVPVDFSSFSRRRRRHPIVSVVVIALSAYLMFYTRADLLYFFQPSIPVDLGEADSALAKKQLQVNRYSAIHGTPDRKSAMMLKSSTGSFTSFFRIVEGSNRVFVAIPRKERTTENAISTRYVGRVVHFDELPYRASVISFLEKHSSFAHDFDVSAFLDAVKAKSTTLVDTEKTTVTIAANQLFWINVSYPEERIVQFAKRQFRREDLGDELRTLLKLDAQETYDSHDVSKRIMDHVGVPYVEDEERSTMFSRYIVISPNGGTPSLYERLQQFGIEATVLPRQVSYSARWDQLDVKDRALAIDAIDPTAPARYRLTESEPKRIEKISNESTLLPRDAILFVSTASKFQMPGDAYVIVGDVTPSDHWYYVGLYVLLSLFIVLNCISLWNWNRSR